MNRRGFLKALGIGAAAAVVAPLMPLAPKPYVHVAYSKGFDHSLDAARYAMISKLVDNAIDTHDRLFEEALFAQVNMPGHAHSLVGFSEVLRDVS